ncbi:MAG: hypothetical protein GY856_54700 [bacterium]|nr:hypothetical protein [bacterium]
MSLSPNPRHPVSFRCPWPAVICGLWLLCAALPAVAQPPAKASESALDFLARHRPAAVRDLSPVEHRILEVLTRAQADAFVRGADPAGIELRDGRTLADLLRAEGLTLKSSFSLTWWTVDGGGGTSSGDGLVVAGTIGQPDAGGMTGGDYALQGGFWAVDSIIFADGFESGDCSRWSSEEGCS